MLTPNKLKDMHLLCNAYWLDTDALQGYDLPKIKAITYGFNQNADVVTFRLLIRGSQVRILPSAFIYNGFRAVKKFYIL